jgi:hypothetical protein
MLSSNIYDGANVRERLRAESLPLSVVEWWETNLTVWLVEERRREAKGTGKLLHDVIRWSLDKIVLDLGD